MATLVRNEIRPGLNVFLDAGTLVTLPGVLTNTRRVAGEDRAADDFRPFLVVQVEADGVCLCVPLFSKWKKDRLQLDRKLKTGPGKGWIERDSFFSPFQFWIIPTEALIAASTAEMNGIGNRQRYADAEPEALTKIAAYRNSSDTDYHALG